MKESNAPAAINLIYFSENIQKKRLTYVAVCNKELYHSDKKSRPRKERE